VQDRKLVLFLGPGGKMTTNTLTQLVIQECFGEKPKSRLREISQAVGRAIYEEWINPLEEKKLQRIRLAVYTAAAYLALC